MSAAEFKKQYEIRWADLDANRHLANTAFGEYAIQTRFSFLAAHGFPPDRFAEIGFGPVVFRDDTRYYREVLLLDTLTVNIMIAGLSADARKWRLRHEMHRSDGKLAASLTSDGAWLDLRTRRLTTPPEDLAEALRRLPRTGDFEDLDAAGRKDPTDRL